MDFSFSSFISKCKNFLFHNICTISLFLLILILVLIEPSLLSFRNFRNIFSLFSPRLLMAMGLSLFLILGCMDFSGEKVAAFAALMALFLSRTTPLPLFLIIILVLLVFAVFGLINALLVTKLSIPSWAATLGTMCLANAAFFLCYHQFSPNEDVLIEFSTTYRQIGTFSIGTDPTFSLPLSLIISLSVFLLVWLFLSKTSVGKKIYTFNKQEIVDSSGSLGLSLTVVAFILAAILFSFGGIMESSRSGELSPSSFSGFQMDAFLICLLSGFSLFGGKGTLWALLPVTFLYTAVNYFLELEFGNPYWNMLVKGCVLVVALSLDMYFRKRRISTNISKAIGG